MKALISIKNGVHTITIEEYFENEFKNLTNLVNTMGDIYPKYVCVNGKTIVIIDFNAALDSKPDSLLCWHNIHLMFKNKDLNDVVESFNLLINDSKKN